MDFKPRTKYLALGVLLLAIGIGTVLSYSGLSLLVNNQGWVEHTFAVLTEVEGISVSMTEAASAARRFITKGNADDAVTSRAAITRANDKLDRVIALTADNPKQQQRAQVVKQRMSDFSQATTAAITQRTNGNFNDADALLKANQPVRDELRRRLSEMADQETDYLTVRTQRSQRSGRIAKWGLIVACLLNLVLVMIVGYVIHVDFVRNQALWDSRTKLAQIVESSDDAILTKTLDGIITSWNKGAERLYGYTSEEIVGSSIYKLAPSESTDELRSILETIKKGESVDHQESTRISKDGKEMNVSITVSPLRGARGEIIGGTTIARDFTEQRRAEKQLHQAQKLEAIGRLAGGIAHDFNNVLCIIVAASEIIRAHVASTPILSECLEHIRDASKRGQSLTRHLLAFSRRQLANPVILELNQHVQELSKLVKPLMGDDVEVLVAAKTDVAVVKIDPTQLDQIILNFAVNARDAMPNGGRFLVEISVTDLDSTFTGAIGSDVAGKFVLLAVSDNGQGMDAQTAARIFDPFFTTKSLGKGTGLGLSTVYGIVNQNHGHIRVYSELGQGTTFKIFLPFESGAETPIEHVLESTAAYKVDGTILVVEDDAQLRNLTVHMLRDAGYTVLDARNGEYAIAVADSHPKKIDLVLTDVVMPGKSGPQLVEALRVSRPDLRFVYVSGYTTGLLSENSLIETGAFFLEKPFTMESLLRTIRDALQKSDTTPTSETGQPVAI
jgi:PAS domain S-box-containing protein